MNNTKDEIDASHRDQVEAMYRRVIETMHPEMARRMALEDKVKGLNERSSLFMPDWNEWRTRRTLELRQLVALSVGINPGDPWAQIEWVRRWESLYRHTMSEWAAAKLKEFTERLDEALIDIDAKRLEAAIDTAEPGRSKMKVGDFVAWARRHGLGLPTEFPGTPGVNETQANPRKAESGTATIADRNQRWALQFLDIQVEFERAGRVGKHSGAQAEAIKRIEAAEGVKGDTVKRGIQDGLKALKDSRREGNSASTNAKVERSAFTAFWGTNPGEHDAQ